MKSMVAALRQECEDLKKRQKKHRQSAERKTKESGSEPMKNQSIVSSSP
jgi:hypothetical protein